MNIKKSISLALAVCIISGNICLAEDINLKPKINLPGMVKVDLPKTKEEAKMMKEQQKEAAKEEKALQEAQKKEAFGKVETMANAGEVQSMYILAHAYYTGQQVEENDVLAVSWWKKAADALYPDADAWIGLFFAEGLGGLPQNQVSADRRYERAVERGSSYGAIMLGIEKYRKNDIDNKNEAIFLFEKARSQGNPLAEQFLKSIREKGTDTNQDFRNRIDWKKEMKKITLDEMYYIAGSNAYKGNIVRKDYGTAVRWWELASDAGNVKAKTMLGISYYTGRGIGQNYTKAVELLKEAALSGNTLAEFTLAKAYLSGNGVQYNRAVALELLRDAQDRGMKEAGNLADNLEGR